MRPLDTATRVRAVFTSTIVGARARQLRNLGRRLSVSESTEVGESTQPVQSTQTGESMQVGTRRMTIDVAVQIVARILNLALGVVVTFILARGLGSSAFGVWSTLFAACQIAGSFGELGLTQVTVSRAAADPEREPLWLGALLQLRLLVVIPITIASLIAVLLIAPTSEAQIAGVMIACVALAGAPGVIGAVFQLRIRNDISMAIITLNSIIWAVAVVAVAALSGGIAAFAAAFLLSTALMTVVSIGLALRFTKVRLRGARQLWGPLLRVGVGVGVAGIFVTGYVKLDQILVFEFAGSHQAGLYGAAYRLLDQVQFIPISMMTTLFPLIAAAYASRHDRVLSLLQASGEYLSMASLPILAFTIVAAGPIMSLLFGPSFAAAAPALPILAGAFVSISFGYLVGNMVVVLELQRRFALYAGIGLLLNAALNVVLIPRYGFLAAAWVTLLTEVTVMSLSARIVLRALHMRPRIGRLLRTLAAAAVMGVATLLARVAGLPLAGLAAVAALSYFPCLLALRVLTVGEVRSVLRKEPPAAVEGSKASTSPMP
jgi:O-antigen/teichoic acid export membrane protein